MPVKNLILYFADFEAFFQFPLCHRNLWYFGFESQISLVKPSLNGTCFHPFLPQAKSRDQPEKLQNLSTTAITNIFLDFYIFNIARLADFKAQQNCSLYIFLSGLVGVGYTFSVNMDESNSSVLPTYLGGMSSFDITHSSPPLMAYWFVSGARYSKIPSE